MGDGIASVSDDIVTVCTLITLVFMLLICQYSSIGDTNLVMTKYYHETAKYY